jgi:hypothetical protein
LNDSSTDEAVTSIWTKEEEREALFQFDRAVNSSHSLMADFLWLRGKFWDEVLKPFWENNESWLSQAYDSYLEWIIAEHINMPRRAFSPPWPCFYEYVWFTLNKRSRNGK